MKIRTCFSWQSIFAFVFCFIFFPFQSNAQTQMGDNIKALASLYLEQSVSLSADGYTLAVGRTCDEFGFDGYVQVYTWSGSAWIPKGDPILGRTNDQLGYSVSLSSDGNVLVVGAPSALEFSYFRGLARVYVWNGIAWEQRGQDLIGDEDKDELAISLSISSDGNILAVGIPQSYFIADETTGKVRVYKWNGTIWEQRGADLKGENFGDSFGTSVSLSVDGLSLAVSAPYHDANGQNASQVKIYVWNGTIWEQKGSTINGELPEDVLGDKKNSISLSAEGQVLAIGASHLGDITDSSSGLVRVFAWSGSEWEQKGLDINGDHLNDCSGFAVDLSLDGNTLAISSFLNDGNGDNSGQVRVFQWDATSWIKKYTIYGEGANNDFGLDISLNGDGGVLAVASQLPNQLDSNFPISDVKVYKLCSSVQSIDTITACNAYDWKDGHLYTASNHLGSISLNLIKSDGCDSIIVLDLTIIIPDTSVVQNGATLTANVSGFNYQWLDYDNNLEPLSGETNQSFTAQTNGTYAVRISKDNCSSISNPIEITSLGVLENSFNGEILFYQNDKKLIIDIQEYYDDITVNISSVNGQLLKINHFKDSQILEIPLDMPNGIYIATLISKNKKAILKFVRN